MYNDLFSIGPFTFHGYGLMIVLGILAAYQITKYRARRLKIVIPELENLALWVLVSGFISAKLLYWLTQLDSIIKDPALLLNFADGYVVYGGIIGGLAGGYLYCRRYEYNFLELLDLVIPSVAVAQAFGRIGCFLAGCCYGMKTGSAFGVVFPAGSIAPAGVPLLPVQLICSALDGALFVVLILFAKRKQQNGQVGAMYLILYGIGRFIIEFFRGDLVRGSVGVLSTSQFISIFIFAVGCCLLLLTRATGTKRSGAIN